MTFLMSFLIALNLFFAYGNLIVKKNYTIGLINLVAAAFCLAAILPH